MAYADLPARASGGDVVATGDRSLLAEPLHASPAGGDTQVLPVAVPVRDEAGVPRGFLVASLRLDRLPDVWARLPLPPASSVMLVDRRDGRILAVSGAAASPADERLDPVAAAGAGQDTGSFRATLPGGAGVLRGWAPVHETAWSAVVEIPRAPILAQSYADLRQRLLLQAGVLCLGVGLLAIVWYRFHPGASGMVAGVARLTARQQADVERAEKARLDGALLVARTVAHEINNALTPVLAGTDLLLLLPQVAGDSTVTSYLHLIVKGSEEVAERVAQLQRIVRLEEAHTGTPEAIPMLDLQRSAAPAVDA
jgi:hypothetical protein